MKHACAIALLFFINIFNVFPQSARQLIDSARFYKNNNYSKVISLSASAYKQAVEKKQTALAGESAFLHGAGLYLAGNLDETLRWYFEAERKYTAIKDTAGLAELYCDMCVFYVKLKKFQQADEVSKKAIAYSKALKNDSWLSTAINNRGLMFMDKGDIKSAISSFKSSYALYKKLNDKTGMAYSLDYLSSALSARNLFAESLSALNESIKLREGLGDKTGKAIAINNIGELYLKEKKPAEAAPYFIEAIKQAHALDYPDLEVYSYSMLAQTYRLQGKYREAYDTQSKYVELNQKLQDKKGLKTIEEMQTRYDANKKEQQNKLLKAQNNEQLVTLSRNRIGIYSLLAITILSAILFYLLYNKYKLKQQAKFREAMLEEQRLRTQGIMDAEENERQRLARELHDGIGQQLCAVRRQVESDGKNGDDTLKMLDESIKEVRDLSHSMMPPSLLNKSLKQAIEGYIGRVNNEGSLTIETEWVNAANLDLDKTTTLMIYRSIQEIISNIFKHAKATSVHIELVNHETELSIVVYDNGIGFDKEKLLQNGQGLGLKNIQSRIGYIGGEVQIDTMPGKGVTYVIELPLISAG